MSFLTSAVLILRAQLVVSTCLGLTCKACWECWIMGTLGKKAGIDGVKAFIHHGAASHGEGVAATQIIAPRP